MLTLGTTDFGYLGSGLVRPECIVATAAGAVFASHGGAPGGIARIGDDGEAELILARTGDIPGDFIPNGYALMPDGSFVIANVGNDGGVYRLHRDGTLEAFLLEIDGRTLPACNFVNRDEEGRIWISVSTWFRDRDQALRKGHADGFVILVDERGARIAVDGIGYTNENKVHPSGRWLYVHETVGRSICRFELGTDGRLGPRETVAEYGPGIFPDGFEFDAEGGIWCTSVVTNRIVRISPEGDEQLVYDDADPELAERAQAAWENDSFGRDLLNAGHDHPLGNCASICFAGPDLRTCMIGSLAASRIATFRSPIAGARPPHWSF